RFPKTFFVFLEGGRRVSLQEYLASKYPLIVKRLRSSEIDRSLLSGASSGDDWILIRKDRGYPKLFFSIHPRTMGGTSVPNGGAHAAYLEFVERAPMKKSGWFRRAA